MTGFHNSFPYGGVTQTIATSPGSKYSVSLDLGTDQSIPTYKGPISVVVSAGTAGSQTFTYNPGGTGIQWQQFGFMFTANSANTPINIVGESGINYIGVDNASVLAVNSSVPEPGTYALLGSLGLAGATLLRRRRAR